VLPIRVEAAMAGSRRKPSKSRQIQPRVKVWLERGGQYVFGFGISQILKAVEAAGSIKGAAERLGKSYRHVWARIKEAEEALGESLVHTRVGGRAASRSSLTEPARRLVTDYDALRRRMFEVLRQEFSSGFERPTNAEPIGR
jgi:molybdate transport system regulatory protein